MDKMVDHRNTRATVEQFLEDARLALEKMNQMKAASVR
jgi:hypothetical protein